MKKIVFLTGTRADYGKLKALMQVVELNQNFELQVFVTGMHMLSKYGSTYREVLKDGFQNVYQYVNSRDSHNSDITLSNTITGFSNYVEEFKPNLIVVHGDRIEALAGAIVGALNNIQVAHIEGGEISGTIDESIRHAITKFAHIHLVANEEAQKHIVQLGEREDSIHIIGSPDIDVMRADQLPSISETKERYGIPFFDYGILLFHPVTTEVEKIKYQIREIVEAVKQSGENFIIIYPNNDLGCHYIFNAYKDLEGLETVRMYPSLRFEHFLTLLKSAQFLLGNSSAGIREAGVYGIPAIDIGNRQKGRYTSEQAPHVIHVEPIKQDILQAMVNAKKTKFIPQALFGEGNSARMFEKLITEDSFWESPIQKQFIPRW